MHFSSCCLMSWHSESILWHKPIKWLGPHGISLIRWLIMMISQRINHSDLWDWPNCPNGILLSHWYLSSQSCETTRFQTSSYVTIPSENFSLVGYKDSIRKGKGWFSLRASHPLFPSNKFPFLAWLPGSLFLCTRLTLLVYNVDSKLHANKNVWTKRFEYHCFKFPSMKFLN